MALEIDIKARLKSAARETVPLVILSSVFLVFFDIKDWSIPSVSTHILRAVIASTLASVVALTALWIGLSTAQAKQNKLLGWIAGGIFSLLILSLVIWFFRESEIVTQ
jgi:hypothetical protein